jgi:hypothetical protein
VPQNTLHKQDLVLAVRHARQFLKMRILEPEDGGSRVTKSADYIKNKLLSTKLESSNKLKHKNINPFGFPSFGGRIK